MSRDLEVFVQLDPSLPGLAEAIESVTGLAISDRSSAVWDVVRGAKGKPSFAVDLPARVQREDLPERVLPLIFEAAALVTFSSFNGQESEFDYARKAARAVAKRFNGVVYDPQADAVTPRRTSRQVQLPPREEREISIVEFTWMFPSDRMGAPLIETWLELCRLIVPEALPRRFGEYEPFQGRIEEGGQTLFIHEWDNARGLLFFSGKKPVEGGHFPPPGDDRPWVAISLTVFAVAFDNDSWTHAFRELFTSFANESRCVYAYAEVVRGVLWSGSRLGFTGSTEGTNWPATPDGWVGLLPYPVFWAWYGDPYRELVRDTLKGGRTGEFEAGLMHELTPTPKDRDILRSHLGDEKDWVSRSLRSTELPNDGQWLRMPLVPAHAIPDELANP